MQDADAVQGSDQQMLKKLGSSPFRTKASIRKQSSPPAAGNMTQHASGGAAQAVLSTGADAAAASDPDVMLVDEKPAPTAPAAAAAGAAQKPPAKPPASKKQRTAAANKRGAARKPTDAAAAEAEEESGSDTDAADGAEVQAAAAAAADAATFTAEEVTEVNTSLLAWYDRVMRILPWRRNPHHKPDQQQQQGADGDTDADATPAAQAAAASSAGGKGKQRKASKAELAAAEAAAVVAAAKPAPADLSPQQFAYYVWVSEIMLQQTQVARVIPYHNNWIAAWPTVQDLAKATQEQVNEVWAGLGYYRRARYLLEGAQFIVDKLGGTFPETAAGMRQIPGVGPYTAAAVSSIAFNDPAAAVDGNVIRVVSRLRALRGNPTKMAKTWDRLAAELLHPERPGCHNQAMMELGATVCKPVNPLCEACPVSSCCAAYKQVCEYEAAGGAPDVEDAPRVTDYPEKVAKAAKHEQHVAVCVVKALLLPGVSTPAELEAAAAAAAGGGSNGTAAKKPKGGKAAAAAAAGSSKQSKQGSIRAFLRPAAKAPANTAAAAAAGSGEKQQQQLDLTEADVLAAGGAAHYLLVQRPATGLLAGLWEFPGVIVESDPTPKARRAAVDGYLSSTLGVSGLQPGGSGSRATAAAAGAAAGGGCGVRVLHRRQLGSAVHVFSHIRQTMHAEELLLLAPSLDAVCGTAAPAAAGGEAEAAAAEAPAAEAAAAPASAAGGGKKRKAGSNAGAAAAAAGAVAGSKPCMRWVSAAEIGQAGLTSGVRKVLQLSLK